LVLTKLNQQTINKLSNGCDEEHSVSQIVFY